MAPHRCGSATTHNELANAVWMSFLDEDGQHQSFSAGSQHDVGNAPFASREAVHARAVFEQETFEIAEAIEQHFGDFALVLHKPLMAYLATVAARRGTGNWVGGAIG